MNKQILSLAIPNILSNLSIPLLSSVDTAIVGHLEKVSYLGAIAIGSMIFNFIYWGFGFLRMGTTGLTAQAFGQNNKKEISLVFARSAAVALFAAFGLIVLQFFIAELSFFIVESSYEVETYARDYFNIRIYAAPATLLLYTFHGWFLGMQNAKYPLILAVFVNVLNIVFNLFFIMYLGLKTDGVAYGTVCAQYLGLVLAIILFMKKYSNVFKVLDSKQIFEKKSIKKFFAVNRDILIRTLSLVFVFTFFTTKSALFGEEILAANTILLQLWMILSFGIDGFAFAAESLVGKYYGENNLEKLKKVISNSFYWAMGLGVSYALVYYLFGRDILLIFTDKINVVDLAMMYFSWTVAAPILNTVCYMWDGVFIGATATKPMRNTMLIGTFLFFLPAYYLLENSLGNNALWLSMALFMTVRGVALTFYLKTFHYTESRKSVNNL